MGIWNWLIEGTWTPPVPVSPFAPQDSLETAIVGELFGVDTTVITAETAVRVGPLKRALQVHMDTIGAMPLYQYQAGVKMQQQPGWLHDSASGIAPLIRTKGLVKDLFLHGQALLGCETDGDSIADAVHIPQALWKLNTDGTITVNDSVSRQYQRKLIYIPLGDNGVLADAVDTIRQARALDLARTVRLESPPAGTELHITDPRFDEMTPKQKQKMARDYAKNREASGVSVTPSYIDVKEHGDKALDLFETATNSIRLDVANHTALPASILEGAKSGSGGDMTYSNETGQRSEIYDLGSRRYADAITARLSLDDVCEPGTYIGFDRSELFAVPTPTTPQNLED
jgi:hypothetical protein